MKNFDLKKIKDSLPHGAITEIAEKISVDPRTVSEVFIQGWHKDIRNEVVSSALEILKRNNIDPEVIKEAAEMQFTTDSPLSLRNKKFGKRKKVTAVKSVGSKLIKGDMLPVVVAAGAVLLLLLFGKKKPE